MTINCSVSMAVLSTSALPIKLALLGVHLAVASMGARDHV